MSQWGSQNCARAGYNFVKILEAYYRPVQLADTHQLLTPDDFTFTGRSTRAQWDPATGNWSINDAYGTVHHYGVSGDIPTVLNTGDGLATIGVFRPSTGAWYISGPTGSIAAVQHWGMAGDIPVPAHYNGSGAPSVLAIYRPSTGAWWVLGSPTLIYGGPDDIPVPGHYGSPAATDHADGVGIFRPSTGTWYLRNVGIVHYGAAGDIPVPGDYNGDGITDVAVYRPSTHQWLVQGSAPITYGARRRHPGHRRLQRGRQVRPRRLPAIDPAVVHPRAGRVDIRHVHRDPGRRGALPRLTRARRAAATRRSSPRRRCAA